MQAFDRSRAALLLLDFQNYGVHPEGWHARRQAGWPPPAVTEAVQTSARVLVAARQTNLLVVHIGAAWREGSPEMNLHIPVFARGPDRSVEGSWGADFVEPLKPVTGEISIIKRGISALAGTELDRLLCVRDIHTLALAGIATNFAVEGTAREAVDRGYQVIALRDCCASVTEEMHDFSINAILAALCAIATGDEFIARLGDM